MQVPAATASSGTRERQAIPRAPRLPSMASPDTTESTLIDIDENG